MDIIPPNHNGQWGGFGAEIRHFAIDRHSGGVNSLFSDGSVRKVRVKDLWRQKWHKTYDIRRVDEQKDTWWGPWLGKVD